MAAASLAEPAADYPAIRRVRAPSTSNSPMSTANTPSPASPDPGLRLVDSAAAVELKVVTAATQRARIELENLTNTFVAYAEPGNAWSGHRLDWCGQ